MLELDINGRHHRVDAPPLTPLVSILRDYLGLKGTKIGCGNGECGACTVVVDGDAVCACLLPAHRAQGKAVTTVEGLDAGGELSALQQAFIDHGALQCGFCTPGMLMAAHALRLSNPHPDEREVVAGLAGNVCRCTGYRQIIDAVLACGRET